MSLIEKLRNDYDARKRKVEVLGVEVFVTPLTVDEQVRVNSLHPNDAGLRTVEILVLKCRDANGEPVFTKEDKQTLKRAVAGDRLAPIMAAINGSAAEEQAKN